MRIGIAVVAGWLFLSSSTASGEDDERGLFVGAAADRSSGALVVDVATWVRGSRDGQLRDGDTLASGDEIHIEVTPTRDAHVHLAYCDRNQELTVFPQRGSIPARAGQTTLVPGGGNAVVLDDRPGDESLYVVVSRYPLASADPVLAAALRGGEPGRRAAQCGPLRAAAPPKRKPPPPGVPSQPATDTRAAPAPPSKHPPVTVELARGMYIGKRSARAMTVAADTDGITVVRYRFKHVRAGQAPRSP